MIYFASQLGSPVGWPAAESIVASVDFQSVEAFDGSALPTELNLDDWDSARLDVLYTSGNRFIAEIHTLTPVDVLFLAGDFNGDGVVNAQDLGVWHGLYGWEDANLAADAERRRVHRRRRLPRLAAAVGVDGAQRPRRGGPGAGGDALVFLAIARCRSSRPDVSAALDVTSAKHQGRGFAGETRILRPHKGGIMA